MQSAKSAAATAKESAANVAASAKAGLDKAKATVQEKVEKMSAHDPLQKDMATHKKEERIHQAEHHKQEAREHNAAAKHVAGAHTNQHISTTGGTMAHSGFTTPDYLTGSDFSSGHNPAHTVNVEYPSPGNGLNPPRDPSNMDTVYPTDIGAGQNQAHNAHGGGPTSAFGTGGLIN